MSEPKQYINIRDVAFPGEPPLASVQSSRADKLACPACGVVNPIHFYADGTCSHCVRLDEEEVS